MNASRWLLIRLAVAVLVLGVITGCDSEQQCPSGQVKDLYAGPPASLGRPAELTPNECSSPAQATENAIESRATSATMTAKEHAIEESRDDYEEAQNEAMEAMEEEHRAIEEEQRRRAEEERKEAIRSCILAGNQPNLCELDPYDPYGEIDQP